MWCKYGHVTRGCPGEQTPRSPAGWGSLACNAVGRAVLLLALHHLRIPAAQREREFFIDKLLVRIHFIIVMITWTGLAPCEFNFAFPGSLSSILPAALSRPFVDEYGTYKTVQARSCTWLSGKSPQTILSCSLFAWQRTVEQQGFKLR